MKKITKLNLYQLAKEMPVIPEIEKRGFVGGGDGTQSNPYTQEQWCNMVNQGNFPGGYVQMSDGPTYCQSYNDQSGNISGSQDTSGVDLNLPSVFNDNLSFEVTYKTSSGHNLKVGDSYNTKYLIDGISAAVALEGSNEGFSKVTVTLKLKI